MRPFGLDEVNHLKNENVGVITDYIDATAARMNHKLQLQQKKRPQTWRLRRCAFTSGKDCVYSITGMDLQINKGISSLLVCVVTTANAVSAFYLKIVILIHEVFIYLFSLSFPEMHYETVMKTSS